MGLEQIQSPTGASVVLNPGWGFRLMTMITLSSGTSFLMWLGEQITERGLGNGASLLIFFSIVERFWPGIFATFGFVSHQAPLRAEVRVHELARFAGGSVDLDALKAAGIVSKRAEQAKVIASGSLTGAVAVKGLKVTPGARALIEAAGGSIE
jgi:preprotein translocase subunit SecY